MEEMWLSTRHVAMFDTSWTMTRYQDTLGYRRLGKLYQEWYSGMDVFIEWGDGRFAKRRETRSAFATQSRRLFVSHFLCVEPMRGQLCLLIQGKIPQSFNDRLYAYETK